MRQVVSMVKDGRVQYALHDDETGELTEFAQILVPDHFELHETAMLGTNIIQAIGLNGRTRKGGGVRKALTPAPTGQPSLLDEEPAELPPADESRADRKRRLERERWHARQDRKRKREPDRYPSGRARPDPANRVERFISIEEVLAVIDHYPEGIRSNAIAERIWRLTDGKGTDDPAPKWVLRSVENRLSMCKINNKDKGTPLPFGMGEQERPPTVDGTPNKMPPFVLYCALPGRERGPGD